MRSSNDARGRSTKPSRIAGGCLAVALAATTFIGALGMQPAEALTLVDNSSSKVTLDAATSLKIAKFQAETEALIAQEQAEKAAAAAAAAEAAKPANIALACAKSLQGTPYVSGGASPETGFDCSGFTMYCYAQAGINLTHNAAAQYSEGTYVAYEDLQPGDLVFFGSSSYISHVGMYVGDGQFIHSPQTGEYVRIDSLSSRSNYVGACRVA